MKKASVIRCLLLAFSILGISTLHYFTPLNLAYLHDIFQRLYYLPIILAALWFGFRGGLICSLFVSVVYAPHILFQWGGHFTMEMEKYLEILLYNVVGGVTGLLSQRERERSLQLQETALGLKASCKELQLQSEKMILIEEQLRRAEKLSTLGEMAAVLAHEIRNPLGSIRGTAEILKDDHLPYDAKHEFIDIQIKETERLNRVVEDFLKMARPRPADMQQCVVQDELETIANLLASEARQRGIELKVTPPPVPVILKADGEKLRQAFLNILMNALQACHRGGCVAVSTVIDETDSIQACELSFRDDGSGIDKETLERMFEPFYTTKPDGTGLGLAVTKKIVESHGGTLTVDSGVGSGTTVAVRLPMPGQEREM